MNVKDVKLWLNKLAIVTWLDSGADETEETDPKMMGLCVTNTVGKIVYADKEKTVLRQEWDNLPYKECKHTVIQSKAIQSISDDSE